MMSARQSSGDCPLRGFAVDLRTTPCLAIENAGGFCARVLAGQVWITEEGAPRDTIAEAGMSVALEPGVRFNFSAFHDAATVLITAPSHVHDVDFSLKNRDGMRVLSVAAGRGRVLAGLSACAAAVAAFTGHVFAPTWTSTT
jgi:hypothetical protein